MINEIKNRRSIREYLPKPVENEKLERILKAGQLAPTAKNKQNLKFIVVRDPETKKRIAEASRKQMFIAEADCVVVICGTEPEYVMMCGQPAYVIDASIAADHMILQATAEGLGSCWIGAFDEKKVKEILNIPDSFRVPILFTLGYPAFVPPPSPRKSLDELVFFEKWGEKGKL
ncbi:MAG: nitroreductase family protein [bacterium]